MKRQRPDGHKLRVVFVDHVARLSGGELAMLQLLPALAQEVDVRVILGEEGRLVEKLQERGIAVEVMPLAPSVRDLRKGTLQAGALSLHALARVPPYVVRLSRRLRELDSDIVHTNSLKAALYGGVAGRLARIPVVWHVRDRIADDYLPRNAVTLVRTASRILPTAVVANSQATLETLPHLRRGRVVYNPVVPPTLEREPRQDGPVTIGVVGRLAQWKGQHVFLDAFAEALRGTDVRGRIIGSALFGEGAYARELAERAERLGISGQVEFRGFREDVWAELAELDVLVHCSVAPEPFGQVVLEGMAAGVPVIAANAGGPAELITSGVDGILTAPGDAHALARSLQSLVDDPALRATLGAAGRERSLEFTPERTTARLLAVYREIVSP